MVSLVWSNKDPHFFFSVYLFIYLLANYFTILYWFCPTLTWIHHGCTRVPHPESPSHVPPHPIPLGHPSAPSVMHQTWTGDSFHIWQYTCFNAILPNLPTFALSHRVQKTVLYICVSFAVSHIGLLLLLLLLLSRFSHVWICATPLSKFHIYALVYCIGVFLSGLLCIIGSSFIHLIRTDSNVFFLMAE